MKAKYFKNTALCLGTMALAVGSAVLAQAASAQGPQRAAKLLNEIKADAVQVRSAAAHLDKLTQSRDAKWLDYDRQWNEIKPSVEDMQMKLRRLEAIQATISPAERKELDQSKARIQQIQARTRELGDLLDKPGVQTSNMKFKAYARSLRSEAGKLERTVTS